MKCPFCSYIDNRVIDSRLSKDGSVIRRRRECNECGRRFTTHERVEEVLPLVIKKDNRREPFDRDKILRGVKRACEKRPVSIGLIEKMVDRIENHFQEKGDKEVGSTLIGEEVMRELHALDQVAYVRFASVYRSFRDINEFMAELKDMLKGQGDSLLQKGGPK
jgi:transcriptional repressor NrdR